VFEPSVDVEVEIGGGDSPQEAVNWQNTYKLVGQDPLVNREAILNVMFKKMGENKIKRFRASSQNAQGDAVNENNQIIAAGVVASPKAGDNHQIHMQIHTLLMQSPAFMQLDPVVQQRFQAHVAEHMTYLQAAQAANAQAQQAQIGPQDPGATPVGQQANAQAEAMMNMGNTGASQAGAGMES
jgi:hypothetical protein